MKDSLIKLLLALLLVVNPVAVLASGLHDLNMQVDQTMEVEPCHQVDLHESTNDLPQNDGSDCEMPCCEDSECFEHGICIINYNSDLVAQKSLRFHLPFGKRSWSASIAMVPDRGLPPENPPPIHI